MSEKAHGVGCAVILGHPLKRGGGDPRVYAGLSLRHSLFEGRQSRDHFLQQPNGPLNIVRRATRVPRRQRKVAVERKWRLRLQPE